MRDIALDAGANPGSVTYHFKSKDGLLLEIYKRHCGPMNKRRIELLVAAQARARRPGPAGSDRAGLCAAGVLLEQRSRRRRRALHAAARRDVGRRQRRRAGASSREIFDDTTNAFIEAIEREPAASAAHDDRLAIAVPARRTLLYPRQPGARHAAVARRSRRRRHGGSDRATGRGDGRLVAGVRRRSHRPRA